MTEKSRLGTTDLFLFVCFTITSTMSMPAFAASEPSVRGAVERGLAIVQKAANNYPKHRKCFSCHHQTLPILAMTAAETAGIKIDRKVIESQSAFTRKSFRGRINRLKKGTGIGGRAMTVSYGLWMLTLANGKPDELSSAMVTFLLKTQRPDGSWKPQTNRPPLEESRITNTVLAIDGMRKLAQKNQSADVTASIAKAEKWLSQAKPKSNEDRMMLLWYLHHYSEDEPRLDKTRKAILAAQNEDGGWSQKSGMSSDAYATGQNLYVLHQSGVKRASPAFQKGIDFLLKTQKPDGSWFVKTRSRPVQVFFDNGDPHGKSQFISVSATAWATAALAVSLPEKSKSP